MILAPTDANIQYCSDLLSRGELVAFPTETVYGLGASALDADAVAKIFAAKGRPSQNPLIVHISNIDTAHDVINFGNNAQRLSFEKLSCLWPGPLTIVLPKSDKIPNIVASSLPTIGIRIPNHPVALSLLQAVKIPIAAPSANRSNYISPTTAQHVMESFPDTPVLDGGPCDIGLESTIVSLIDPHHPIILRVGALSKVDIAKALASPLSDILDNDSKEIISPGMMKKHYSPQTKLQFLSDIDIWSLPPMKIGLIAFSEHLALDFDFHAIYTLSSKGSYEEIAYRLYDALRAMDNLGLDLILVDSCIESGLGIAIMDRLKRAATKG